MGSIERVWVGLREVDLTEEQREDHEEVATGDET